MSVLYDYFRAPDDDTAILWAVGPDGDPERGTSFDELGVDWIDAKNLDPYIVVGTLVAFASGTDADTGPDLRWAGPSVLWPELPEDGCWEGGLLLQRLPDDWVPALAAIADDAVPELAARWCEIPEIGYGDAEWGTACVRDFVAFARRAAERSDTLYCRIVV